MSQYTTGEVAKLCGVTVRTVQYYDVKELLIPSDLTEGGRRLYSVDDVEKLKLICLLKSLGLSLSVIKEILLSKNQNKILITLLNEQSKQIKNEMIDNEIKLESIGLIVKNISGDNPIPLNLISDMALIMKEKAKLNKTYIKMTISAIVMAMLNVTAIVFAIVYDSWGPILVGLGINVVLSSLLLAFYYNKTAYICPHCNEKFKPKIFQFMFANHTLRTRKLNCPKCGVKDFCIETTNE